MAKLATPDFWKNGAAAPDYNSLAILRATHPSLAEGMPEELYWENGQFLSYLPAEGYTVLTGANERELIIIYQKGEKFGALMGERHFQSDYVTQKAQAALAEAAKYFADEG